MLTSEDFAFFLNKIAYFNLITIGKKKIGKYLVDAISTSSWLPQISIESQENSAEIFEGIFVRIKSWAKGHLMIILIETAFYLSIFYILSVPYAPILGLIAGLTILVPILGPIISFLITALVCLALGESLSFIVIILSVYLLMNMIIEQFFLYPKLVGKSLGLSTIETIIVVFLGSLIAGISGIILAIPIASVLKYIFPIIYSNKEH